MNLRSIKPYIKYLYIGMLLMHSANKFLIRPWVLEHHFSRFWVVLVNSLPNFLEAVVGIIVLTGIGLLLKVCFFKALNTINNKTLLSIASVIAGIYVITQELKIHNLGGRNVYDPNDLIASIIGLVFTYLLIYKKGILKKEGERELAIQKTA
ncbi:hypothetical protein GTQ40_04795 [Flavobacteriaceae bacterium R38]|nr:hypothetical protein [Flavobacteriaceae bacterium R38]